MTDAHMWIVERKNKVTGEWVAVTGRLSLSDALAHFRAAARASLPFEVCLSAVLQGVA